MNKKRGRVTSIGEVSGRKVDIRWGTLGERGGGSELAAKREGGEDYLVRGREKGKSRERRLGRVGRG